MLKTALLLLTLSEGDTVRVTLSEAADAQECEANRDVISQVLAEAGTTVIAAVCGTTALRLSPFAHGMAPGEEIHLYRVVLPGAGGFVLTPLPKGEVCRQDEAADPAVYCARSAQSVLGDG